MEIFKKYPPLEVTKLCRVYRAFSSETHEQYDPWFFSYGADLRLSSEKHGIKIGYWAETIPGAFEETILHRKEGQYMVNRKQMVSREILHSRNTARITLHSKDALKLVPLDISDNNDVVTSAYYGMGSDKDEFVNDAYNFSGINFDGIAFRSNQNNNFICYGLFDRGINKLRTAKVTKQCRYFNTKSLASDSIALVEILKVFPELRIENPSS